ncbi:LysR family transcriptional regulator [Streptomyces sp. NPDC057654]|uniref:LysR family transcriptional regulator n=1 Tax=Streptomyces sp. NPDC057654 TaxID=3346196 RepID=UPI00367490C1
MSGLEMRELECFLALSEELHFGRAAERLYVSQGRVSQLLRSLEARIGARLLDRTSRRVALTPLGARFLAELRPAYDTLRGAVESARAAARGLTGVMRVGFQGNVDEQVTGAVRAFRALHPDCEVEIVEVALGDPFGAVRRGEVDAAIVLMPVAEPDLVVGAVFPPESQTLAVSVRHPFARRASIGAEELAGGPLLGIAGPAPAYWLEFMAPPATPGGLPIPRGPLVRTNQEALLAVAAERGAMVFCAPTAAYYGRRDIVFVPVTGLPPSTLCVVWPRQAETERVRAFNRAVATGVARGVARGDALSAPPPAREHAG